MIRNHLYNVFQLFDFGDGAIPEGDRPTSTVAPQALFMMNSELVHQCAGNLARQLLERSDLDDAGKVRLLYGKAYARPATEAEVERGTALLKRFSEASQTGAGTHERLQAWTWLSQVMLASNEFVYVR